MKKLSLILALTLVLCFTSSCAKAPKRIELTKDNYDDYIAFNITFDDFKCQENPYSSSSYDKYNYSCTMIITTYAARPNIQFENVKLEYNINEYTLPSATLAAVDWGTDQRYNHKTHLSCDGYSQSTIYLTGRDSISTYSFPSTYYPDLTFFINSSDVSGTVIITE